MIQQARHSSVQSWQLLFLPYVHNHLAGTRLFSTLMSKSFSRQSRVSAAYYRGGTSRAVFFNKRDLPTEKSEWDSIFRGCLGSPDQHGRQLDGMGGGISSLSKVCVIGPATVADADVDYTFAAIGVKTTDVDYSSNCGNMLVAVGPYAIDAGFVTPTSNTEATVKIHNTNTGKIIYSSFAIVHGEAAAEGDFSIEGVSGTGSRVQLDFIDPAGSRTGKMFPTENKTDTFDGVSTTCIDVGNPCCFVHASALDVSATITPSEIDANHQLLSRLESIRGQAAVSMGLAVSPDKAPGSVPKICLVSAPTTNNQGAFMEQTSNQVDLVVRAMSVGQPHKAVPITVALALATAAKIPGTTVSEVVSQQPINQAGITIGHASGKIVVDARFDEQGTVTAATVFSTARRLMEGTIFWKGGQ